MMEIPQSDFSTEYLKRGARVAPDNVPSADWSVAPFKMEYISKGLWYRGRHRKRGLDTKSMVLGSGRAPLVPPLPKPKR